VQSIRVRLAVYYSLALTATMVAFGAAVYWERSRTAPREAELQVYTNLDKQSNFAAQALRQEARTIPPYMRTSPTVADTLVSGARVYLDGISDYVFVADANGRIVYFSPAAQSQLSTATLSDITALLVRHPLPTGPGSLGSSGEPPLLFNLAPIDTTIDIGGVLVAARPVVNAADRQQILLSMLMMGALVLVASASLGYWLAGRSMQPVEIMIEELEAIQDGTSLNRRLAVPPGEDELSRLAQRLNDMLGRVERSFVALRRFTADASHELKTPLMVLRAGVERSLTHPQVPGEILPALDETLRQINQMSELVNNLLTLARADEGRASLVLVDTDLRTLVAEAAETAEILGADRQVAVKVELPPYAVMLPVDAARIRHLLMNLVTNAIKYTPAGGHATVRLVDGPDTVTMSVQDTGIGIAPGDLPNVFERFWRADISRSRAGEHPGTGLGLAISKWIAEAHGGEITVQSRPGRGSTFTAVLPKPIAELAGG
jgi:two-component system OmpR family sensor kinase